MKEKIKTLQEVLLEKTRRLREFAKLFPNRKIPTDPYGTPLDHQDKTVYLRLSELSSYVNALNWILGLTKREIEEEINRFQSDSFISRPLFKGQGDNIKKTPQEIRLKIKRTLGEFIKKYQTLSKEFERANENDPRLLFDGDPLILKYNERKIKSITFGELKALLWYLGADKKLLNKKLESKVIDGFDTTSLFEDF